MSLNLKLNVSSCPNVITFPIISFLNSIMISINLTLNNVQRMKIMWSRVELSSHQVPYPRARIKYLSDSTQHFTGSQQKCNLIKKLLKQWKTVRRKFEVQPKKLILIRNSWIFLNVFIAMEFEIVSTDTIRLLRLANCLIDQNLRGTI